MKRWVSRSPRVAMKPRRNVNAQVQRALLINVVSLNGGDAAIMESLLRELCEAAPGPLKVTVMDRQAAAAARYHEGFDFVVPLAESVRAASLGRGGPVRRRLSEARVLTAARLRRRGRPVARRLLTRREFDAMEHYAGADLAVSTGGTYLDERYRDVWTRIFEMRVVLALGIPLVLGSQTIGVFRASRNRRPLRRVLRRAAFVFLRDEASERSVRGLGVTHDRVAVVADAAFTGPGAELRRIDGSRSLRVALSVRDWPYAGDGSRTRYRQSIAALADHLTLAHGADVTFVSTCQGIDEYWMNDAAEAARIVALTSAETRRRAVVDDRFRSVSELLDHLGGFDCSVATRMHFAILSLSRGLPVLPISYENKIRALFDRLGMGEYVLDYTEVTPAELCARFDRWLSERSAWEPRLQAALDRERASAREMRPIFAQLLGVDAVSAAAGAGAGARPA
jgi:colanic acid/amylovoran biosynthesis protein